jgi:hypothetical protein
MTMTGPWKSGPSGPRHERGIYMGFSPGVPRPTFADITEAQSDLP